MAKNNGLSFIFRFYLNFFFTFLGLIYVIVYVKVGKDLHPAKKAETKHTVAKQAEATHSEATDRR